jgi:MFS family permease
MTKIQQIIIFINKFSLGIMVPILNLILLEKGADLETLPIIMALYAVTVLCFELPSGVFADLYGRKTVFLLSCGFQVLSLILLILSNNVIWLIFSIIFNGISRSFSSGSLDALVIDQAITVQGEECLPKITSRLAILDAIGLATGSIAGGIISYIGSTYLTNIVLRIGLVIIVFILCLLFIRETQQQRGREERISLSKHLQNSKSLILSVPIFKYIFIGVFFTGFFIITLETYWQSAFLRVSTLADSSWVLGIITFIGYMAVASGSSLSLKALEKFRNHHWRIYILSQLILCGSILILALQRSGLGFILGYAGIYLLLGLGDVVTNSLINKHTPNQTRASILSLNSFILQIGAMCASLFSSIMVSRLEIWGIWIVAGSLIGGYAFLVTLMNYRVKRLGSDKA